MGSIRGMRDIKTHSTLAREGRLISVAKNLRRINRSGTSEERSWGGKVEPVVFNKSAKSRSRRPPPNLFHDITKVQAEQIARVEEFIAEMEGFAEEGLPGALGELQCLKEKLSQLKSPL